MFNGSTAPNLYYEPFTMGLQKTVNLGTLSFKKENNQREKRKKKGPGGLASNSVMSSVNKGMMSLLEH